MEPGKRRRAASRRRAKGGRRTCSAATRPVWAEPSAGISRILLALASSAPAERRLAEAFEVAREVLGGASVRAIVRALVEDPALEGLLCGWLTDSLHLGFLSPMSAGDLASSEALARAAGLEGRVRWFPSTAVARELGLRLGRPAIPTSILKAELSVGSGARYVEAFFPVVEPEILEGWLREGVGLHVGLEPADRVAFDRVAELLEREGYSVAEVMKHGPISNPSEVCEIVYFEREGRVRLELVLRGGGGG